MFYSHFLLSKKGALGTIWVAAHCHKRLKKDQVKQTDISSSVDKILLDEVPVVTYRILAFLLLGVVRIYSKKVEYLFHDCHDVLSKLHDFKISKGACETIRVWRKRSRAVARPKRFELDAFDLELLEDQESEGGNAKSCKELMLADGRIEDGSSHNLFCKGIMSSSEEHSTACTPPRDVYSPHHMEPDSLGSPLHMNDSGNDSGKSLDMFHENIFSLDDHLDPMVLDDTEEQQIKDSVRTLAHDISDSMENYEKLDGIAPTRPSFQVNEQGEVNRLVNEEQPVDGMKFLEVINTGSKECRGNLPVSLTVDVTPDSKLPGVGTPEVANVKTPAPKEGAKVLKKRKMIFDRTTVLSNKVYKSWIDDPGNITCKRRKVPHTLLHAWRIHKLCHIFESFLEPLVPRVVINIDAHERKRKVCKEPDEPVELPSVQAMAQSLVAHSSPERTPVAPETQSLVAHSSPERTPVAPETPVTDLNSLRSNETGAVADSEILEPIISLEILENRPASSEAKELQMLSRDELSCSYQEANPSGEVSPEKYKYASRTRMTGRYLYKNFLYKKRRQEEEVVKLSELLSQKTRKESARLFYEILVLKMENGIDVKQDSPYGDILLLESSELKQISES